ncbi:hypothetical protein D3C81_1683910 [compost metagenome]
MKGTAATTSITQDNFGFKVSVPTAVPVGDEIKPVAEKKDDITVLTVVPTGTANQYKAIVKFNENITVINNTSTIKLSVTDADVENVVHADNGNQLEVTFSLKDGKVLSGKVVTVQLLSDNANVKVVKDGAGNAAEAFTASVLYN